MSMRRVGTVLAAAGAALLFGVATVAAQEAAGPPPEKVAMDTMWVLITAALVFFMQAGFAMVEAGLQAAKNVVNILMKNLMDFTIASVAFWAVGFGLMFGAGNAFFGTGGWFLQGGEEMFGSLSWTVVPMEAKFFFQLVFAGTAATIVSGAIGGRVKFSAYLWFSLGMTVLIYPLIGHWIWGGGWLAAKGFFDFAGSTVVHAVGGWAALAGAMVLGPRIGKYGPDGKPRATPGHSMSLTVMGVFVLWLGWFGFNPGSTMAADPVAISHIFVTTNVAAATGAIAAMFLSWILFKKPDASMTFNGVLAGLVAITAPCAFVGIGSAAIIGAIGGVLVVLAVIGIERAGVDDPVGAVAVHGVNGVWGTISLGLFAAPPFAGGTAQPGVGLLFGGGATQLIIQVIGTVAASVAAFALTYGLFVAVKATIGMRVTPEEEIEGLDIAEHGNEAYPTLLHPIHTPALVPMARTGTLAGAVTGD
jgi:Amt family ammonium transporter